MISRRKALKMMSGLPLGGVLAGGLAGNALAGPAGSSASASGYTPLLTEERQRQAASIYSRIGVRPLINCRGTVTVVGATRVLPQVQEAMDQAVLNYVQLDELMDGVGRRLAELTGAEYGCVTSGASAAITLATAGCVTGGDPDKIWQLPDLRGMKDEVIIPSYSRTAYDSAARAVGVRMVPVSTVEELEEALGPRTAMILVLTGGRSENGPLSLREIASLARPRGVPILADAAAEELYNPNPHLEQGADLVAYSGGKCLRGPQCAGLLIGREDLVRAAWLVSAPHHGFGRGFKVGREEVMGMLAAVETWFERDHEQELATWNSWLDRIENRIRRIRGVNITRRREPTGRGNRFPGMTVEWDMERIALTGHEMEQVLWDNNPRIAVSGAGSFLPFPPNESPRISINPSQMEEWEVQIVADKLYEVLSRPPRMQRPSGDPALDLTGQWDLKMSFAASDVDQTLMIEQKGSELMGTHTAAFAMRDLGGWIHGNEVLIRSSYTGEGVRLNFEFAGTVQGDSMGGRVSMGEYGMADWSAVRRDHRPPGSRRG